jgi:hypothetical protein
LKNLIRNQHAKGNAIYAFGIVIVLVIAAFGYLFFYNTPAQNNINPWNPAPTQAPVQPGAWSGQLYLSVVDKVLGTAFTTSAVTVNQIVADNNGVFDFISGSKKTVTQSANPQAGGKIFNEGQQVIVQVTCTGNPTNGLDYYPVMYYVNLREGATIYQLDSLSCFQPSGNGYTINVGAATPTNERVFAYEASNIKYWNLGDLGIYPRQAAADFDMYLSHNAITLASVVDASTWVDTAAEITANTTLTSATNDKLTFTMVGANANLGWGKQFFVIDSEGQIHPYGAVIVVTTGILSMEKPNGWNVFAKPTMTDELGFYKVIQPEFPQSGMKAQWSVDIPMSVGSDATKYLFKVWVIDCQPLDTVGTQGTTTSMPNGYGFVDSTTDYGVGAAVQAISVTVSSGASATPQLMAYVTTP